MNSVKTKKSPKNIFINEITPVLCSCFRDKNWDGMSNRTTRFVILTRSFNHNQWSNLRAVEPSLSAWMTWAPLDSNSFRKLTYRALTLFFGSEKIIKNFLLGFCGYEQKNTIKRLFFKIIYLKTWIHILLPVRSNSSS